jgi:hypothetical protein
VFPPLFATLNASSPVKAVFGTTPLRVYSFGDAPAKGAPGYAVPYAVFQTITGNPENNLSTVPDMDGWQVQIDVFADKTSSAEGTTNARNAAKVIRDALEPVCYVTSWNGEGRDTETLLFRYSFDVSFLTSR